MKIPWYYPRAIGVCGFARVGKDTAGRRIRSLGYKPFALADPLKALTLHLNPEIDGLNHGLTPLVDECGWEAAKSWPGVREYLVKLGTAGRQTFAEGENFWIEQAFKRVGESYPVFTDIRFLNEAKLLRERFPGAVVLRITRPGFGPSSSFEDEVPLIPADVEFVNDGEIEDLHFKLGEWFFDYIAEHTTEQMSLFQRRQHAS